MTAQQFNNQIMMGKAVVKSRKKGRVLFCDEDTNLGLIHASDNRYYRFTLDSAHCINTGDHVVFDAVMPIRKADHGKAFGLVKDAERAAA